MELLDMPVYTKWNLVYRASRDGFSADSFHSKCDFLAKFLVLIKTNESYVFGGYTESDWSLKGFKKDTKAILFSLINKENNPIAINCSQPEYAVYSNPYNSYGPTFGKGFDIYVSDNSDHESNSFSNLGTSYKHPNYTYDSVEAKSFLAGSYNFKTTEIEVFFKDRKFCICICVLFENRINVQFLYLISEFFKFYPLILIFLFIH